MGLLFRVHLMKILEPSTGVTIKGPERQYHRTGSLRETCYFHILRRYAKQAH
jgi:hypothetical protein